MIEENQITENKPLDDHNDVMDILTQHFRQVSRGRIVDLPRWAQ